MKFGVHFLLPCGIGQTPIARYRDALAQGQLAEELGFESVWPAEQHAIPSQSVLSCPAVFLAALAARTQTIRLGTAIVQLPLFHPLRVAEEICTLDVISGGRAELGVGRGTHPDHYAGFGASLAVSRERLEEGLDYLRKALSGQPFDFHGRHYTAEAARVVPEPVQPGGPALRLAANSVDSFRAAGRAGIPILTAIHINPPAVLAGYLDAYHSARAEAGHQTATPDDITVLTPIFTAERESEVTQFMGPAVDYYAALMRGNLTTLMRRCGDPSGVFARLLARLDQLDLNAMRTEQAVFGTPEACVKTLASLAEQLGAGRFLAWFDFVGTTPAADVERSMRLFAAEVAPRLTERLEGHCPSSVRQ
ncbi:LLM class flavin-dependent oxidoreductase [Streptomyces sp. NPDC007355]|uniref:LLM class flavin-dependent oxidoreductase n=1 Tax=Streptomyces sp. NPDC007355 TaxID=3364778 RepID=UPI0036A9F72D